MVRTTIDELLAQARRRLRRLDAAAAVDAMRCGATLIDIRSDSQITEDGVIAGALVTPRNVLEWRLDPASKRRHPHPANRSWGSRRERTTITFAANAP
jgi:hypothetical protein